MSTLLRVSEGRRIASHQKSVRGRSLKPARRSEYITLSELCNSSVRQLRLVECEVAERTIVLRGTVSSYYEKQLAQEMVRAQRMGWLIANLIEVVQRDDPLLVGAKLIPAKAECEMLGLCH